VSEIERGLSWLIFAAACEAQSDRFEVGSFINQMSLATQLAERGWL
jgi:hypothetical protein